MNPLGIPALVAGVLMLVSATVVYRSSPTRLQTRLLAAALVTEAFNIGITFGVSGFDLSERTMLVIFWITFPVSLLWPTLHIALVSTLDSPLARPLRSMVFRVFLTVQGIGVVLLAYFNIEKFVGSMTPLPHGGWLLETGPWLAYWEQGIAVLFAYTLAVAISAWRRATDPVDRRRAKAFAIAFGVRDIIFFLWATVLLPFLDSPPTGMLQHVLYMTIPAITGLFVQSILAYGILQVHLFDIDIRLRRGVSRGTVAAIFVALYVVVSQTTERLVTPALGPVMGLVAAGVLVLGIVPLQRAAERFSARLFPSVRDSAAYVTEKKLDVYRAALHDAITAGALDSPAEEKNLARLREALGLTQRDHAVLLYSLRASPGSAPPADDGLAPGAVFAKFIVERPLGEGSFARTYLARDDWLARRVVLKLVRPDRAGVDAVMDEARAMARVHHPNVITVHEVDKLGDQAFIVLEHAEGGSLKERLARGPLAPDEFALVAQGLLRGLDAVHEAGMVHRDVKPANVLLTAKGDAKLADFGVAHLPGFETTYGGAGAQPVGTLRFMSPEQARGRRATARSDLYAAAATLFEARTGRPFIAVEQGETVMELRRRVARGIPYPAGAMGEPALDAWFEKALRPAADDRFATAREMADALAPLVAPPA